MSELDGTCFELGGDDARVDVCRRVGRRPMDDIQAYPAYGKPGLETETADLLITLLNAGRPIVSDRQDLINDARRGHKGFTDERLGLELMDRFKAETLRMFADPRHPKGQQYAKATIVKGKPAVRVLHPDYADAGCLTCHGSPKGERDVTGMKREGWKEGALAGVISVVAPIR